MPEELAFLEHTDNHESKSKVNRLILIQRTNLMRILVNSLEQAEVLHIFIQVVLFSVQSLTSRRKIRWFFVHCRPANRI